MPPSFALLDTGGVDVEQPEGGLLERGWSGMEGEAVLQVYRHAHGVASEGAEMGN
jgi:hypothetical protein